MKTQRNRKKDDQQKANTCRHAQQQTRDFTEIPREVSEAADIKCPVLLGPDLYELYITAWFLTAEEQATTLHTLLQHVRKESAWPWEGDVYEFDWALPVERHDLSGIVCHYGLDIEAKWINDGDEGSRRLFIALRGELQYGNC